MKYTSQQCCDKTMDNEMASYHACCFLNVQDHCEKSYFRSFMGVDLPNPPPLDRTLAVTNFQIQFKLTIPLGKLQVRNMKCSCVSTIENHD